MATARALLISLAALCLPAFANIPRASLLIENSHPGLADVATTPHQADAPANPLIAPGLPACLCDEGRRTSITGKERDAETGLDYFGARYMSSAQGRFTSADEWSGGIVDAYSGGQVMPPGPLPYADIGDPQTLNKCAYVRNNPLRYVDPDGHCVWDLCIGEAVVGSYVAAAAGTVIGAVIGLEINAHYGDQIRDQLLTGPGSATAPSFGIASKIGDNRGGGNALAMMAEDTSAKGGSSPEISEQKQAGHVPGTAQNDNRKSQGKPTSDFFGQKSGEKLTQKAWKEGTPVPGKENTKVFKPGISTGTGPNGGMQKEVKVHQDKRGRIHGHPSGPEHE